MVYQESKKRTKQKIQRVGAPLSFQIEMNRK